MKKPILISAIVAVIIVTIIFIVLFLNQKPKQDIAGNDFDNFYMPEKEQMCCENCLNFGDYEDSKDCLEIIKKYGGLKHCYWILRDYPHSYTQCKQLLAK